MVLNIEYFSYHSRTPTWLRQEPPQALPLAAAPGEWPHARPMSTFFGPRGNSKRRVGTPMHTAPGIVLGKRGMPLNCHGSRVGGRQAIFYLAWQPPTRAAGVCRPPPPAAARRQHGDHTVARGPPMRVSDVGSGVRDLFITPISCFASSDGS